MVMQVAIAMDGQLLLLLIEHGLDRLEQTERRSLSLR